MAVAPARVELARLRLEDVFVRIVSDGTAGSDAARALRAGLRAPGAEGAVGMKRVWLVASREFMAAVANKGFVIGLLLMPAIFAAIFTMMPRLMNTQGEQIRGDVRVIDPTGQILEGLRVSLTPEAITRRRLESTKRVLENAPGAVRAVAGDSTNAAMERAMGAAPALTLIERPATADVQREKSWLTEALSPDAPRHLALVVVHPNAVKPADGRASTAPTTSTCPRTPTSASRRPSSTASARRC